MLFLSWQSGFTSDCPKQPEELRAIKASALLARKNEVRAIIGVF